MNQPQKNEKTVQKIKCAMCDFEVRDSEVNEVLTAIQSHAKRKHGKDFTLDQLRSALEAVEVKA